MGWGDDFLAGIATKVESAASNVAQSATDFISNTVSESLIRIGPKPTGNLTAQEIADGERGGGVELRSSSQDPSLLSRAAGSVSSMQSFLPYMAFGILGIAAILLLKRR